MNWFLIGDIHGEVWPVERFYTDNNERLRLDSSENTMILLGDVGCNFSITGTRDINFKTELSKYPFTYVCLRGNHEARASYMYKRFPDKWEKKEKYGGKIYVEKDFPQIEYLSDGPAIYEFAGFKTLSLPGAYSIDKNFRLLMGWPWFKDEQLSSVERAYGKELIKENFMVDLVISHTCPLSFIPTDLFIPGIDQSEVDNTMEEYLQDIEFNLHYKRWAFGHYHADRLYPFRDGKEMMMLFNEKVIDLVKFMNMSAYDYWSEIEA